MHDSRGRFLRVLQVLGRRQIKILQLGFNYGVPTIDFANRALHAISPLRRHPGGCERVHVWPYRVFRVHRFVFERQLNLSPSGRLGLVQTGDDHGQMPLWHDSRLHCVLSSNDHD